MECIIFNWHLTRKNIQSVTRLENRKKRFRVFARAQFRSISDYEFIQRSENEERKCVSSYGENPLVRGDADTGTKRKEKTRGEEERKGIPQVIFPSFSLSFAFPEESALLYIVCFEMVQQCQISRDRFVCRFTRITDFWITGFRTVFFPLLSFPFLHSSELAWN